MGDARGWALEVLRAAVRDRKRLIREQRRRLKEEAALVLVLEQEVEGGRDSSEEGTSHG